MVAGEQRQRSTAILVVNGFRRDRKGLGVDEAISFPWLRLCLDQIERFTTAPYEVLVWDNSALPEHREICEGRPAVSVFSEGGRDVAHGRALDRLIRVLPAHAEYIVTLDTDSFPVRGGWLENLTGRLDAGAALAGIWRDEFAGLVRPYVHPSCLAVTRKTLARLRVPFLRYRKVEVAQNLSRVVVSEGGRISRLRRTNVREVHHVMGGIYGDLVYHHGAGSRQARFQTGLGVQMDEAVRVALRDAAFEDLDGLIDFLAGDAPAEKPTLLGSDKIRRYRLRPPLR